MTITFYLRMRTRRLLQETTTFHLQFARLWPSGALHSNVNQPTYYLAFRFLKSSSVNETEDEPTCTKIYYASR
jgi:hypothetical protein